MKRVLAVVMVAGVMAGGVGLRAAESLPQEPQGPGAGPGMHDGAQGQGKGPGGAMVRPEAFPVMLAERILNNEEKAKKLGLTKEQTTAIKEKFLAIKQAEVKLRAEMELAALAQAAEMTKDEVSEAAIMAAIEKTGGIRTELAKLAARRMLVLKQNLTAEQVKQVKEMLASRSKERNAAGASGRAKGGKHGDAKGKGADKKGGSPQEDDEKPGADQEDDI
ncbi:MAG: hypothetical protein WCL44_09470 [bacterium]